MFSSRIPTLALGVYTLVNVSLAQTPSPNPVHRFGLAEIRPGPRTIKDGGQ
jgi:hypothetical protein